MRFSDIRLQDEMGMTPRLLPYQDWTEQLRHVHTLLRSSPIPKDLDFDMTCNLYFRLEMGLSLAIDGSEGVYEFLKTDRSENPPCGPD